MAKKKKKVLEIPKSLAIALLKAMGFKTAKKMDLDKLTENINAIEELPDEPFDTDELEAISSKLMDAEEAIVVDDVVDDDDEDEDAEPVDFADDDDEDVEDEDVEDEDDTDADLDEDEEEEVKPKKTKKDKKKTKTKAKTKAKTESKTKAKAKTKGEKKESFDSVTLELIQTKPMTMESIMKNLLKKFPDADEEKLTRTTKRRLTGHLQNKYGVVIEKSKKGAYSVTE